MKLSCPNKKWLSFVWAYLECLGFGGLIFGWGSLVYVFKDEGLYLDLCKAKSNSSAIPFKNWSTSDTHTSFDHNCEARDAKFALAFTIGNGVLGAGIVVLGFVSLKFGTRLTRLVAHTLFIIGSLCVAFASVENPSLIFPAVPLLGVAGNTFLATNIQVSFLFPVWGSAVAGLLSGAFDASAGIQLLVKIGHEHGVSLFASYITITCAHCVSLFSTFVLLPKYFIKKPDAHQLESNGEEKALGQQEKQPPQGAGIHLLESKEPRRQVKESKPSENALPGIAVCLTSPAFTFHAFWFSILNMRMLFYITSFNPILEDTFSSKSDVSYYTNAMLYILLFGAMAAVLPGYVFDFHVNYFRNSQPMLKRLLMPCVIPLALTSLTGIMLSTSVLFTVPDTIYLDCLLLVLLRSFLYITSVAHIRQIFPSEYFTTLYGILYFGSGIVSLLQYAFFVWAASCGFQQVNLFFLVLTTATLIHPLYQWRCCQKAVQRTEANECT